MSRYRNNNDKCFVNQLGDYSPSQNVHIDQTFIGDLIKKYIKDILQNTDPRKTKITSRTRGDLYVGYAGISFMFLKLSQSLLKDEYPALEYARIYADGAEEILESNKSQRLVSLLGGNAGIHIVSAAVNKLIGRSTDDDIKKLLKGAKIFTNPEYLDDGQDEMFVGRCGYLMGINWLQKQLESEVISPCEMSRLSQVILASGRDYSKEFDCKIPLMFQYHGREYLGAAHGLSAILFSLLQNELTQADLNDVKVTIDVILNLQTESGNFPSKYDEPDARLIHWCHGASGMIYLMAMAYKIFGDQKYLESCIKCGEIVWTKGLLKKGPGICHGIGSSGYTHLLLYRLTNDQKYLHRAWKLAQFLVDDEFLSESRKPDRPFSLFEGTSGTICFLLDILDPMQSEFPFMNVF